MSNSAIPVGEILGLLTLIATFAGYFFARKSKYIVVGKDFRQIVNKTDEYNIKFENKHLTANLFHYRIILLYQGVNDIKFTDVSQPLSIISKDVNCVWHRYSPIKNNTGFSPAIDAERNRLVITDDLIKKGDILELDIIIEACSPVLTYHNRTFNINQYPDVTSIGDIKRYRALSGISALAVMILVFPLSEILNSAIGQFRDAPDVAYVFNFRGKEIYSEDTLGSYENTIDTMFYNYRPHNFTKVEKGIDIPSLLSSFPQEYVDSALAKPMDHVLMKGISGYFGKIKPPSARADSLIREQKRFGTLQKDAYYPLDSDIEVKIVNPSVVNWDLLSITFSAVISALLFLMLLLSLVYNLIKYIRVYPVLSILKKIN